LQTGGSNAFDYNFWSDYAGTDANDDGIGDTPYYGSGFVDPHPLMYLPTPPTWIEPPADQTVEFEHLFYYELPILYYGPLIGSISDTTHFTIDNRGVVESTGILPIGDYGLRVDVTSIYGFSITATFHVTVVVDGNNPPGWLTIPTDQSLAYGEKFEYQITTIDPSGIDYWILSDTVHFILSVSFFDGGSTARITNNSVLELGSYGLEITVYDVYGNPLSATFEVNVVPPERDTNPPSWLAAPIDQILEYDEPLHLQLAAWDSSGIDHWWLSDSIHFTIDENGLVRNATTLEPGNYLLTVSVFDPYGNSLSADFTITVEMPEQDSIPPVWLVAPADRELWYGATLDYSLVAADSSGIVLWVVDDTDLFTVDWESRLDYSIGRIRSTGVLSPGSYVVGVEVHDMHGNVLIGTFRISVVQRLELTLSGSFDFLLKEEIHLQLSALLTDLDTRESVSGAIVTFEIYDPAGVTLVSGTMVEDLANPGVYIHVMPDTMKDLKLPKGIYRVHARAVLPNGAEAVDMIQFHIDPPGEDYSASVAGFSGMMVGAIAIVGIMVAFRHRIRRASSTE
jgi:hypothetical protein